MRDTGISLPDRFASAPLAFDAAAGTWSTTGALNLPAVAIIILISTLLVIGIRAFQ